MAVVGACEDVYEYVSGGGGALYHFCRKISSVFNLMKHFHLLIGARNAMPLPHCKEKRMSGHIYFLCRAWRCSPILQQKPDPGCSDLNNEQVGRVNVSSASPVPHLTFNFIWGGEG